MNQKVSIAVALSAVLLLAGCVPAAEPAAAPDASSAPGEETLASDDPVRVYEELFPDLVVKDDGYMTLVSMPVSTRLTEASIAQLFAPSIDRESALMIDVMTNEVSCRRTFSANFGTGKDHAELLGALLFDALVGARCFDIGDERASFELTSDETTWAAVSEYFRPAVEHVGEFGVSDYQIRVEVSDDVRFVWSNDPGEGTCDDLAVVDDFVNYFLDEGFIEGINMSCNELGGFSPAGDWSYREVQEHMRLSRFAKDIVL